MIICKKCQNQFDENLGLCPYCGNPIEKPREISPFLLPQIRLRDRYRIEAVKEYDSYTITYFAYDETLLQGVEIRELMPRELVTRSENGLGVVVMGPQEDKIFQDEKRKVLEEAKTLAKFQKEEGIVRILDSFEENGTIYIVMEYLEGELLSNLLIERGPMDVVSASELITPISEALEEVHSMGIIHRSICPENIVVTPDGRGKLRNFGTARQQNVLNNETLTVSVRHGFTPEEQYYRSGVQGFSTDVYGLAATLYKMLTGLTPVDGMTRRADIESGKKDPLIMPRKLNKEISKGLEATILNGMAVKSEDRTGSIKGFLDELKSDKTISLNKSTIENKEDYKWPIWAKVGIPVGAVILALVLFFVIKFGVTKLNGPTTNLAGLIEVPGVEGMDKDPAIKDIEDSKLRGIAVGNVESTYVEAGKVVLQEPQKGTYLRENGAVLLTINGGTVKAPENGKATVPIVVWNTVEETEEKFQEAGLGKPIIVEEPSETVARGLVISTDTAYGTEVDEGSQVVITVSTGSAEPPSEESKKFDEVLNQDTIWVKEDSEVKYEEPEEEGYKSLNTDGIDFAILDDFDNDSDSDSDSNDSGDDADEGESKLVIYDRESNTVFVIEIDEDSRMVLGPTVPDFRPDENEESDNTSSNLEEYKELNDLVFYENNKTNRVVFFNNDTTYDYGPAEEYNKPSVWVVEPTDEYSDIDEVTTHFALGASQNNYDIGTNNGTDFVYNNLKGYPQQWYQAVIPNDPNADAFSRQGEKTRFTYDPGVIQIKRDGLWGIMNYNGEILYAPSINSAQDNNSYYTSDSLVNRSFRKDIQGVYFEQRRENSPGDDWLQNVYLDVFSKDYKSIETTIKITDGPRWGAPMGYQYAIYGDTLYRTEGGVYSLEFATSLGKNIPDYLRDSILPLLGITQNSYNQISGSVYVDNAGKLIEQNAACSKHFVNNYYVGIYDSTKFQPSGYWGNGTDAYAIVNALTGNPITDFIYEDALYFEEGYCPVKRNGKWGFIDESGQEVSEMIFDKVSSVYEGKVACIIDGKFAILDLKSALSDGFLTKDALTAQEKPENESEEVAEETIAQDFTPFAGSYVFASGAGAWGDYLTLNSDGTFEGNYHDRDAGVTGENYPYGTLYVCNYWGSFTLIEKVSDTVYKMRLDTLDMENEPNEEWFDEGVKYIATDTTGMKIGDEFYAFLPGADKGLLDENAYFCFQGVKGINLETEANIPIRAIHNIGTSLVYVEYERY